MHWNPFSQGAARASSAQLSVARAVRPPAAELKCTPGSMGVERTQWRSSGPLRLISAIRPPLPAVCVLLCFTTWACSGGGVAGDIPADIEAPNWKWDMAWEALGWMGSSGCPWGSWGGRRMFRAPWRAPRGWAGWMRRLPTAPNDPRHTHSNGKAEPRASQVLRKGHRGQSVASGHSFLSEK